MDLEVHNNSGSSTTYSLPEHWIQRWTFLSDYRQVMSEVGETIDRIKWTYTDKKSVEMWMDLNRAMDYYREDKNGLVVITDESSVIINNNHMKDTRGCDYMPLSEPDADHYQFLADPLMYWPFVHNDERISIREHSYSNRVFPLSSLYSVVEYMNPTNNRYLLYVYVDDKLEFNRRKIAYRQLGEYIIEHKLDPCNVERIGVYHKSSGWNKLRHELSAFLYTDASSIIEESRSVEYQAVITLIRSDPIVDLLGILRSSAQSFAEEARPISLFCRVNWQDVKDIVFDPRALDTHREVLAIRGDSREQIGRYKNKFCRDVAMPDLEVRPLSVLFLAHIPIGQGRVALNSHTKGSSYYDPLDDIRSIHEHRYDMKIDWADSLAFRPQFIEAAAEQGDNCHPSQLAYVVAYMLGLGPIIDEAIGNHVCLRREIRTRSVTLSLPSILTLHVMYCLLENKLNIGQYNHREICEVLLTNMGSNYLHACVRCLLRLIEHNDSLITIQDRDVISLHKESASGAYVAERKRIILLMEAMLSVLIRE